MRGDERPTKCQEQLDSRLLDVYQAGIRAQCSEQSQSPSIAWPRGDAYAVAHSFRHVSKMGQRVSRAAPQWRTVIARGIRIQPAFGWAAYGAIASAAARQPSGMIGAVMSLYTAAARESVHPQVRRIAVLVATGWRASA